MLYTRFYPWATDQRKLPFAVSMLSQPYAFGCPRPVFFYRKWTQKLFAPRHFAFLTCIYILFVSHDAFAFHSGSCFQSNSLQPFPQPKPSIRGSSLQLLQDMASPTFAQSLGYRSRRSALIPPDVSLSPAEEAVIAARIGYRPVPPPGATESTWFASVAVPPYSQKSQCGEHCHNVDAAQPTTGRSVLSSEPEPSTGLNSRFLHKTSDSHNTRAPDSCNDDTRLDLEKTDATTTSMTKPKAVSRYRQLSWKIDIPHMSEVRSLSNPERQPAISPTTTYPQPPWTAAVRTGMPPPNLDHEKPLMGKLSARGSSTVGA